jgi:hypothetical protein
MIREQFERERDYQAAMSVAKMLLQKQVINEDDYAKIEAFMRRKFCPISIVIEG